MALSAFVGRTDDLAELVQMVGRHRLVTVTGPPGVGKSRLVREAVGQLGTRVRFELPAVNPDNTPTLCVVDDVDLAPDGVRDAIVSTLAMGEHISVLTASREPLGIDGEHLLVVEPLPPEAAAAMLVDRVKAAGASWNERDAAAEVADICARLDHLPLAIELAAARARTLSPTELLALMDRRLEVLRSRSRSVPERHRSLRAAIEVSVDRLDDDLRTLFRRLGTFAGSFPADLAHEVFGSEGSDVLDTVDALGELVERSLLVAEARVTTRYRLLQLVRDIALDELRDAGEWDRAHERLVDTMAAEADDMVSDGTARWSAAVVERMVSQHDELIAAIEWCVAHDERPSRAFRLFLPLFGGIHQHHTATARRIGARLFGRWPDAPGAYRAEALAVLATGDAMALETDQALARARAALDDDHTTGLGRAVARRALALATLHSSGAAAALVALREAEAAAASAHLHPFVRELRGFEAAYLALDGEADEGRAIARDLVAESRSADDPVTEMWAMLCGSVVELCAARWTDAGALLDEAEALTSGLTDGWWAGAVFRSAAYISGYQAVVTAMVDGWADAAEQWAAAIEATVREGEPGDLRMSMTIAAATAARLGRDHEAEVLAAARPDVGELAVLPVPFAADLERIPAVPARSVADAIDVLRREPTRRLESVPEPAGRAELRRDGAVWAISFRGRSTTVRDLKGVHDLSTLLAKPGVEVHCLELMGGVDVDADTAPAVDGQARRAYESRIRELQEDIDDARAANDPVRSERAERELDALVDQLSAAFGLGGRARRSGSSVERARTAVTYRIRSTVRKVGEHHPELGRHLANSVRTGTWCSYQPEHQVEWLVSA